MLLLKSAFCIPYHIPLPSLPLKGGDGSLLLLWYFAEGRSYTLATSFSAPSVTFDHSSSVVWYLRAYLDYVIEVIRLYFYNFLNNKVLVRYTYKPNTQPWFCHIVQTGHF